MTESIVFKEGKGISLTIEAYLPEKKIGKGLLFYYGGGWMNDNRFRFRPFAEELAANGYVVFLPQYRVYNQHYVQPKEELEDVADGIIFVYQHLLKQYGIASDQVAWGGSSAGAHLVLCAALLEPYRSRIGFNAKKMVLFNPVCCSHSLTGWVYKKCGERFDFEGICPLHDIQETGPAILAFHGSEDEIAPFGDMEQFSEKYEQLGGVCKVKRYEGRSHGFWLPERSRMDYCDTLSCMNRFLKE